MHKIALLYPAKILSATVSENASIGKVRKRIASYTGQHDKWFQEAFIPVLHRIDLDVLSWESVLLALPKTPETDIIRNFYVKQD